MTEATSTAPTAPPRFVTLGDSITKHAHEWRDGNSPYFGNTARGEATWARFLDPRFIHHAIYDQPSTVDDAVNRRGFIGMNAGVAGDQAEGGNYRGVYARTDEVLAMKPDVVYLNIGVNDITAGDSAATIIASIEKIADKITNAGVTLIIGTIRPRPHAYWSATSAKRKIWEEVNARIRSVTAKGPGVRRLLDTALILGDRTGEPLPGVNQDGTHSTNLGAFTVAKELVKVLQDLYPSAPNPYLDATGNVLPNPQFSGATGSVTSGWVGKAPTSWTLERFAGSTVVPGGVRVTGASSFIADPTYGSMLRLAFNLPNSQAGGDYFRLRPTASLALGRKDDWVQGCMFLRVTSDADNPPDYVQLRLENRTSGSKAPDAVALRNTVAFPLPGGTWAGWAVIEPTLLTADGDLQFGLEIRCDRAKRGSFTVDICKPWLRTVPDPGFRR